MINKYKVGNPIETQTVITKVKLNNDLPPIINQDGSLTISDITDDAVIYGLGETLHTINKKGFRYEAFCKDEPHHWEDKKALYGAHNFFIVKDKNKCFGYFIDCPSFVSYDMCFTHKNKIIINFAYPDYYLYEFINNSPLAIIKDFRSLIGKSYLPPKWALGYGQSRWSYKSEAEVLNVLNTHIEKEIPLDSIYLDIDYMVMFKNFTVNQNNFPSLKGLVSKLKENNVHLVPIIDAGVKDEVGYWVAEEGKTNNYFCKDQNGKDFIVGVWPGYSLLPDYLNSDASKWFGKQYQKLLDLGIDGFWNDMNEPSLFYSQKRINEISKYLEQHQDKPDLNTVLELQEKINQLPNNMEDYKSFYHNYNGQVIAHDKVHNLYGYFMTKSASEYLNKDNSNILLFSRASLIGAHRYGGVWQGDNYSCWSHLKLTLQQTISLNMVGFLFTGADIGGFAGDCNEELMTRWLQLALFQPLFRNHSAIYTKRQEIYSFDNWEYLRELLYIRYALLDFIYDELKYARDTDGLYFRPLSFDYPTDLNTLQIEDQAMIGRSLMIAPILEANKTRREVYLPETMKMLRINSLANITEEVLPKGYHNVEVKLHEFVIFIKKGHELSFFNKATNSSSAGKTIIKKYKF